MLQKCKWLAVELKVLYIVNTQRGRSELASLGSHHRASMFATWAKPKLSTFIHLSGNEFELHLEANKSRWSTKDKIMILWFKKIIFSEEEIIWSVTLESRVTGMMSAHRQTIECRWTLLPEFSNNLKNKTMSGWMSSKGLYWMTRW